jgi:hypothetical protein
MQLAITQNPHVKDPKKLWNMLNTDQSERSEKLDVHSFDNLRTSIGNRSKIMVK